jgi:hypothetical protein
MNPRKEFGEQVYSKLSRALSARKPEELGERINGILEASGVTLGYAIGLAQSFGAEIDDKWIERFMAEVKNTSTRYKSHFSKVRETPEGQP